MLLVGCGDIDETEGGNPAQNKVGVFQDGFVRNETTTDIFGQDYDDATLVAFNNVKGEITPYSNGFKIRITPLTDDGLFVCDKFWIVSQLADENLSLAESEDAFRNVDFKEDYFNGFAENGGEVCGDITEPVIWSIVSDTSGFDPNVTYEITLGEFYNPYETESKVVTIHR